MLNAARHDGVSLYKELYTPHLGGLKEYTAPTQGAQGVTNNFKLMHMDFLVASDNLYDILTFAKNNRIKLYNLEIAAADEPKANVGNGATPPERLTRDGRQQEWIVKHVDGKATGPELHEKWNAAGFKPKSFYGAVQRCITHNLIKKVKPGVWKPIGKA